MGGPQIGLDSAFQRVGQSMVVLPAWSPFQNARPADGNRTQHDRRCESSGDQAIAERAPWTAIAAGGTEKRVGGLVELAIEWIEVENVVLRCEPSMIARIRLTCNKKNCRFKNFDSGNRAAHSWIARVHTAKEDARIKRVLIGRGDGVHDCILGRTTGPRHSTRLLVTNGMVGITRRSI